MNPTRRHVTLLLASLPLTALAQPRGGEDYKVLDVRQPVDSGGKIEVIEFFWYGCPHCYNLEPKLEPWVAKLPRDVRFVRVPAVLSQAWARDAAIYYTFDALGLVNKLHGPLFDAIHRDHLRTSDDAALDRWVAKQGVDAKKFAATLKSFGVQSEVRRALQLTLAYQVDGTPAMAVDGRYTIPNDEKILDTVDYLINRVRKERARAKKG